MSKINAVRIINLNYNNNAICISDETFQLGGQSTLFSLRNGGGKSVLVQMMTAPFVHKAYRKTKDRPFESYFTTAKPTFLLVEWALEHGAGYCLTGMMVRKSQISEEQSSEPLEIVNFISEYTGRCEQDIYHLPVVEKTKKEVVLKSFPVCRQLFESYKREAPGKFFCYDMNNSSQSRQYFDKLEEYGIYYKEWENIIKKINLKESGLSELFIDCKNEKDLVAEWFLPAVESKLNREGNRMKEFQNIIGKYVVMYKDNKSKIERRDTILQFKEDMTAVEEKGLQYQEKELFLQKQENKIAGFRKELHRLEELVQKCLQDTEARKQECEAKLARLMYEKLSGEVHQLLKELRNRSSNRDMLGFERDALEEEVERIEHQIHLFECAARQEAVDECRKEQQYLMESIAVKKQDEKELEPERQRLGSALKQYYVQLLKENQKKEEETQTEQDGLQERHLTQEKKEQELSKVLEQLLVALAECRVNAGLFAQKEEAFNEAFGEQLVRNIVGDYEPGYLEIRREEYTKQQEELSRRSRSHAKRQNEVEEQKKGCERSVEDKRQEKTEQEILWKEYAREGSELDAQVEERRRILRYLELPEENFWQKERMLAAADRKLSELDRHRSALEQELFLLQKECRQLTSGELLELPEEFKELLKELELHPVSGRSWLEKNGRSVEENQKLIRQQPFLPYALILPKNELKKLGQQEKTVYTSFPVPLIERESLENVLMERPSSILQFSGISFYLWFNENLLDEDALRILVMQKEAEIQKKKEQADRRKAEYEDYLEKRNSLIRQSVTKEKLEQNNMLQMECKNRCQELELNLQQLQEERRALEQEEKELVQTIQKEKQMQERLSLKIAEFDRLCTAYEAYRELRKREEHLLKEQKRTVEEKERTVQLRLALEEKIKTLDVMLFEYRKRANELLECLAKYESYADVMQQKPDATGANADGKKPDAVIEADVEQMEARYVAITARMSAQLQELEQRLLKQQKQTQKAVGELKRLQQKYGLSDNAWAATVFQEKECRHQEILCEDRKKKLELKKNAWNEEDKQIGILESGIKEKKKGILERCGREEPLPESEIYTVDFAAAKNKLEYQQRELAKEAKKTEKQWNALKSQLDAFSEYSDFFVKEELVWEEDFSQMEEEELRRFSGILRRDYRQGMEEQKKDKNRLELLLNALLRQEKYQEEYYRKPLEAMLSVTGSAALLLEQLHTTVQSYDSQMEKLAVDIGLVEQEKERLKGLLEDYTKEVHQNLAQIDSNSTITIREKPIKMLRLLLPDWEENEGIYRQRLDDFLSELTRTGVEIYEKNENAADYFGSRVTTKNLYDSVAGLGNIQIRLYKIEEQREYPITWAEVAKNSGGEGFLSAFVVLASLLHYMRRDTTDIFADKNEGKVLVMDNPFAQTNAAHLLKPLMDMAKKMNTQLICLSGLGGDSIYGRFDNIYVLNLVSASLRNGTMYLRGEHKRGPEEETMVASHVEVLEQMTLF